MLTSYKLIRNILYLFSRVREVGTEGEKIIYRCLKCGETLTGFRSYGKLRILCKCGNAANVYTGDDTHVIKSTYTPNRNTKLDVSERAARRYELFKKHIDADLLHLYNIICDKKSIVEQVKLKPLFNLIKDVDTKKGYGLIIDCLKKHCDMERVPINLVYEPLKDKAALSTSENSTNVMGTTYYIPMHSIIYYTIYLNPDFIENFCKTVDTIAHELAHVYANHCKIKFVSPDEDRGNLEYLEQMTDLLAIVLGMGELSSSVPGDNGLSAGGYLSDKMVRNAYDKWKTEYLSGKNKDIRTLSSCAKCLHRLRVPIHRGTLKITCPHCKDSFTYDSGKVKYTN